MHKFLILSIKYALFLMHINTLNLNLFYVLRQNKFATLNTRCLTVKNLVTYAVVKLSINTTHSYPLSYFIFLRNYYVWWFGTKVWLIGIQWWHYVSNEQLFLSNMHYTDRYVTWHCNSYTLTVKEVPMT